MMAMMEQRREAEARVAARAAEVAALEAQLAAPRALPSIGSFRTYKKGDAPAGGKGKGGGAAAPAPPPAAAAEAAAGGEQPAPRASGGGGGGAHPAVEKARQDLKAFVQEALKVHYKAKKVDSEACK